VDGDGLKLSATDLEISIVEHVDVDVQVGAVRSASRFRRSGFSTRFAPCRTYRSPWTSDAEFNVTLSTDYGQYKMVGHDGADYPALPDLMRSDADRDHRLTPETCRSEDEFRRQSDALRPAMMGIYFQIGTDGGRAVATDGHRLVKLDMGELEPKPRSPSSSRRKPSHSPRASRETARATICGRRRLHWRSTSDFRRVIARLIDESYPNYEAVIPLDNDRRLLVDRDAMLSAVKRVGLYSSSMTNQIRLALKEDEIEISAEDIERSSEAHETIRCDYGSEGHGHRLQRSI
jgi:DNA polymerase III subunit beta